MLGARDLEVGDFDRDGDVDVAVVMTGQYWEGTSFQVWRNRGNAAFDPGEYVACGPGPNQIVARDFDADGDLDVAVAHSAYIVSAYSGAIVWNDGTGRFGPPTILSTRPASSWNVFADDLNADGLPELLFTLGGRAVGVMTNLGSQAFGPMRTFNALPVGSINLMPVISTADLDRDGDRDVLFSSSESRVSPTGPYALAVFANDGAGSLQGPLAVPMAGTLAPIAIEPADVNLDGWADLLVAHQNSQWGIVFNDGAGSLGGHQTYRATEDPFKVEALDVDGDGDVDPVVMGRDSMSIAVHTNDGTGQFLVPSTFDMVSGAKAPASYSNLATGDIDGDGDLDAVVGYNENFGSTAGLRVALNQGNGTFATPVEYQTAGLCDIVRLCDLDSDGWLDLLWRDYSNVAIRLNQRTGVFGEVRRIGGFQCAAGQGTDAGLDACDLNNDGRLDIVSACYSRLETALNLGNATFATPRLQRLTAGTEAVACGDLNNDGKLDVVTNSAVQGYLEVSLGRGDGTFVPAFTVQAGFAVKAIAIADLDRDGILDVATGDVNNGHTMTVVIGLGNGTFLPPVSYQAGYSALSQNVHYILAKDVDYDGDVDVLIPNYASQDVSFFRNQGDGIFDVQVRYGTANQTWDAAYGDFDGDGVGDLLTQVELYGAGSWYYPGLSLFRGTARDGWTNLGNALPGTTGAPALVGYGPAALTAPLVLQLGNALPGAPGAWILGATAAYLPVFGGILVPMPTVAVPLTVANNGQALAAWSVPASAPAEATVLFQAWMVDAGGPQGLAASNAEQVVLR